MYFRKVTDDPIRFFCSSGSPEEQQFIQDYDKHGRSVLKPTHTRDVRSFIKSHLDSCNYQRLIKQAVVSNDAGLLRQVNAEYFDATELPSSLLDAHIMVQRARRDFEALSVEERGRFHHNFGVFLSKFGTPEFYSSLGVTLKPTSSSDGSVPSDSIPPISEGGDV